MASWCEDAPSPLAEVGLAAMDLAEALEVLGIEVSDPPTLDWGDEV